ncbi:MAG: hypothetical protein NVS9B10_25080 [Nevskia sp.]
MSDPMHFHEPRHGHGLRCDPFAAARPVLRGGAPGDYFEIGAERLLRIPRPGA